VRRFIGLYQKLDGHRQEKIEFHILVNKNTPSSDPNFSFLSDTMLKDVN
jgi:hypothetical protein